ncbi:MAG: hypothetical protein QOF48_1175 [Verrucomicrobiota bacterium]|jgi:prepilin-type N-terminal cleavage/methylation domain-containing protein
MSFKARRPHSGKIPEPAFRTVPAGKLLIGREQKMNSRLNIKEYRHSGFTLAEVIVAMGIIGVLTVALYSGMTSATFSVRLARENLRATELLVEKTDGLRLYTWDQLNDPTYMPTNFTASYYDNGTTNNTSPGITYSGSIKVSPFPTADRNYSNDMRVVTITINWTSGKLPRTRTLNTYYGRYGIQNYVAN